MSRRELSFFAAGLLLAVAFVLIAHACYLRERKDLAALGLLALGALLSMASRRVARWRRNRRAVGARGPSSPQPAR